MRFLFSELVYRPLYNGLVFLTELFPSLDLGLVIIILTVIVKFILLPLSLKAIKAQRRLKEVEPELKEIREKYKDDRESQALKTMELYRERKIKPFSGLLLMLIQIPIILGLYSVFLRSGLPDINPSLLYSFISAPDHAISHIFLGIVDVTKKSLPLAVIVGILQYLQSHYSLASQTMPEATDSSFGAHFAKSMSFQMKYVFPFFIAFIAYTLNAATAIYFATGSIFHIFQEIYVQRSGVREVEKSQ